MQQFLLFRRNFLCENESSVYTKGSVSKMYNVQQKYNLFVIHKNQKANLPLNSALAILETLSY